MNGSTDSEKAFELVYNDFYHQYGTTGATKYPIPMSYAQFLTAKSGTCQDACNSLGMILRSMGIKCVCDYSVQWGNQKNAVHRWIAYPQSDSITLFIDNDTILKVPHYAHSGKFIIDEPGERFLVDSIPIQRFKKGTKIRRIIFKINPNSVRIGTEPKERILAGWDDLCSIDVTGHYLESSDIILTLNNGMSKKQFVYLEVFGLQKQTIVDIAEIEKDQAHFYKVATGNVYFPVVQDGGRERNILAPFIVHKNGEIVYLKPDYSKEQNITVTRKYPLLAYTLNNANKLFHGKFQGANTSDFSDAFNLYEVDSTFLFPHVIEVNTNREYQYLRYVPTSNNYGSIAEIGFYSIINGKEVKLEGTIVSNCEGLNGRVANSAFDEDFNTFFVGKEKGSWVGVDLGNRNQQTVSKIMFCPRTDTNFIIPGNDYELLYWDGEWISQARKKTINCRLEFENVPQKALYWLHCLDGGKEERPFTYEKGKQIWW